MRAMKKWTVPMLLSVPLVLLSACEKEISVDLPDAPERLVVEGNIEPGMPPFVILTRAQGYFEPTSLAALGAMFVSDAAVTVTTDGEVWTLPPLCSGSLTPEQVELAAAITGLDPALLGSVDICVYTSLDPAHVGVAGKRYDLRVETSDHLLTGSTRIPVPVALDSTWFQLALQRPDDDTLGFAWCRLTDPDTMGNCYRWMARRISHRPDGSVEDPTFISPLGTTFDDRYLNGLTVELNAIRGRQFYSNQPEDNNEEQGFFKVGDTIAVKFVSLGRAEHDFYRSYEENVSSAGDMFGTPVNVRSNIDGGLGIWAGWGVFADTIICQ